MKEVRSIPMHVRVSPEMKEKLNTIARQENRKTAALLAILLEEAVTSRARHINKDKRST